MKKILLLGVVLAGALWSYGQVNSNQPPYLRFPAFPPVKFLLPDSSSYFTKDDLKKKSAVMLMVFNPQCDHCQHETEELLKNIDRFKSYQIIMATVMPFDSMMAFRKKYKLAQYKNIVIGQDPHYFLPSFYRISNLPFLAFYNRKRELISVFEGSMPMEKALAELRK